MSDKNLGDGKKEFEIIFKRCVNIRWGALTEQDTLTKFIHPLLRALGWDLLDFNQVREEVLVKTEKKENHMDIVLYSGSKPYIGIEVKSLSYGSLLNQTEDGIKESVTYLLEDLLRKSKQLNVKYAVLTRFAETIVVDPRSVNIVTIFRNPREHLEKFDSIWKLLSKPESSL